jgi:predicted  nucleic acid-binding Zn-ribbon protein
MSLTTKVIGKVIEGRLNDLSQTFEHLKNAATDVKSYILVDLADRLESIRTEEDDERAAQVANEIDAELARARETVGNMRDTVQKAISESELVNKMIDDLERHQNDLEDHLVRIMEARKQSRNRTGRK